MATRAGSGEGFRLERVSVEVGEVEILHGLDVVIPLDGITVVAGPSGAGKSTLLRLCNRLEVPTTGRILLDGVDLGSLEVTQLRRRVGMVFQRPVLFGGSVRENLLVADAGARDEALVDSLQRVGLDESLLARTARDLSGGEAQRLCLARTLLTDPEVLLMDEPTSSLDPGSRAVIERYTTSLVAGGLSVVWVTHDLAQARRLADHTVVLVEGRLADADEAARFLAGSSATDELGQPGQAGE